jgi:hypothetical protein
MSMSNLDENAPTIGQARNVLELLEKKKIPKLTLQLLIQSGLLSDLLDLNYFDLQSIDRTKFREFLGLPAISSK